MVEHESGRRDGSSGALEPNGQPGTPEWSAHASDSDLTCETQLISQAHPQARRASRVRTTTARVAHAGCPTDPDPPSYKWSHESQGELVARGKEERPAEMITGADRSALVLVIGSDSKSPPRGKHPFHGCAQPAIDLRLG